MTLVNLTTASKVNKIGGAGCVEGVIMTMSHCNQFQSTVSEHLVRYRSVLDVMSKLQESSAHVNRAIVNSVTSCGCLKIDASKQPIPDNITLVELAHYMRTHIDGSLCPGCLEALEEELGHTLFYLAGICSILGLDLDGIISKENEKLDTLGVYSLT
jgi:hypothetical protein